MQKLFYRDLKIGVLGGGQLGRMLLQAAIDYNLYIEILDSDSRCPCSMLTRNFHLGYLTDYETVYRFGEDLDMITIEIENVNVAALEALEKEGKMVYPQPHILRMIQDKRLQKQWLKDHNIPTSDFVLTEKKEDLISLTHRLPAVHKLGSGGYDGRGVQIIHNETDISKGFDAPSVLEDLVPIQKELAVIVARNPQGETSVFPLVEMVFHPTANLVEYLMSPAEVPFQIEVEAEAIAREIVNKLEYVGLMAVELFWDKAGKLWVNELAPRPHNSGHHTIRSCATSQYEQHLRAILGLPLGAPTLLHPAAMLNLLGEPEHSGKVFYQGVEAALKIGGVYPHFYGKTDTKPFRKMGHVTILDENKIHLIEKVRKVQDLLKVVTN